MNWSRSDEFELLRETNFRILLIAAVLPPMGFGVMSPLLESLILPLGASESSIGLLMSVFTAPAIVMIPVAGAIADRYGRKPVLAVSLIVFGLSGVLVATTTDFDVVLGLRFVQGAAYGGVNPITITGIGDIYSGTKETTAQGMRVMGGGLSNTLFPLLSGVMVLVAWQLPFVLYALALPVGVAVWLWYDDPTNENDDASSESRASYGWDLWELAKRPHVIAYLLGRGFPVWVWVGFVTYNSIIVTLVLDRGPATAGFLTATSSICFALAAASTGRLSGRFPISTLLVFGILTETIGFGIILFARHLPVAVLGTVGLGGGFGVLMSVYRSIVSQLARQDLRAGLVSISEAGGRLMATLTPVVLGGVVLLAQPIAGEQGAIQLAGITVMGVGGVGGFVTLAVAWLYQDADPNEIQNETRGDES